jgi:hypothetical protein
MLPPRPCRGPSAADAPPVLPAASFEEGDDSDDDNSEDASPEHGRLTTGNPARKTSAPANSTGDNPARVTLRGQRCMCEPSTALSVARWKGNETPNRGAQGPRSRLRSWLRSLTGGRPWVAMDRPSALGSRSSSAVRCRRLERVLRMICCQGFESGGADGRPRPPRASAPSGSGPSAQSSFRAGAAPVVAHRAAAYDRAPARSLDAWVDARRQPAVAAAN